MAILTAEQQQHWQEYGWLLLPSVLTPQVVRTVLPWVDNLALEGEDHVHLQRLIVKGLLPAIAAELLGEEIVLYKEKINYKPISGAGYVPHQDATAFPSVRYHVTCLVAVDPMTLENGCLEFTGRPAQDLLLQDDRGCIAPDVAEALTWTPVPMPSGGVLFVNSYAPHRSGPNRSTTSRRAICLTYNALSEGDLREPYYQDREHPSRVAEGV